MHRREFLIATILLTSSGFAYAEGAIAPWETARRGKGRFSMDDSLQALCQKITNIFEVDNPLGDYAYVEDLGDGRGFTVTHYGFCENTGDLDDVVEAAGLAQILETKTNRGKLVDDLVEGAGLADVLGPKTDRRAFPANWKRCLKDKATRSNLIAACDSVARRLYWDPAVKAVKEDNLSDNPFAYALYYDTLIQHGGGDDPDSFYAIRSEARGDLTAFLKIRKRVLLNASDPETRQAWRESVDRVDELADLRHNSKLTGNLQVSGHTLNGLA
jgi:chitosanase